MPLSTGTRLGPYEILASLGAGGMGEVYRARDTRLGREVAVKILPQGLREDRERLARFEKESRSASALNHPAIVTIHDVGEADGVSYIAMELVAGHTLRELLAEGVPPMRRALQIGAQVADGLARAHEAGIVHRDLKPENVMVTPDGFAKVLDFGLAKLTESDGPGGATHAPTFTSGGTGPGVVMGTVGYMSPEQALGRPLDARSDQFALGSILYEMATGKRAFARGSAPETLSAIIRDDPEPIGSLAPSTPTPLRWVVERCLSKEPSDRYASTRDLARDLATLRDRLSETSGSGTVAVAAAPRRRLRGLVPWILAAAAAALAAFALTSRSSEKAGPALMRSYLPPPPGTRYHLYGANTGAVALSRDGRRVAFGARDIDGHSRLWVRDLAALEAYPVKGGEGALFPFWSPDGRSIGFFAKGKLKVVEASPSPPPARDLADVQEARGGTWGEGGTILYAPGNFGPLFRVSANGGVPEAATRLDTAAGDRGNRWPHFLPGGRRYLYEVRKGPDPNVPLLGPHAVFVGSLDGAERREVLGEDTSVAYAPPGYLLFRRADKLMAAACDPETLAMRGEPVVIAESVQGFAATGASYFSVAKDVLVYSPDVTPGQSRLVWLDRSGKEISTVAGPGRFIHVALAPDGRSAVVAQIEEPLPPDLWLYDTDVGRGIRLTRDALPQGVPAFAPDGRSVFFSTFVPGRPWDLFEITTQGVQSGKPVVESALTKTANDVSPDGRFLLYREFSSRTRGDLKYVALTGDRTPRTYLATTDEEGNGDFSPDGNWVAYSSDVSGRMEIYAASFPDPTRRFPVSSDGGSQPRWSRDGKELFYIHAGKLMAVPVTRQADGLTFGESRPLFPLHLFTLADMGFDIATRYDVAPDGRFLALLEAADEAPTSLVLVEGWRALLKDESTKR